MRAAVAYALLGLRLSELGPTPADKLKILLFASTVSIKRRVPVIRDRWVRLTLAYRGHTFACVLSDRAELDVIDEVLLGGEYEAPVHGDPKVIVDLGSSIGLSIILFRTRYPQARIYGFEPDPKTFAKLRENTRSMPGVTVQQVAVAGRDGHQRFYPSNESWVSSLWRLEAAQLPRGARSHPGIHVEVKSLDSIAEELRLGRIGLMKIDIEGAEYDALASYDGIGDVDELIGELHADISGCSPRAFFELLEGYDVDARPNATIPGRYLFTARRPGRRERDTQQG